MKRIETFQDVLGLCWMLIKEGPISWTSIPGAFILGMMALWTNPKKVEQ